MADFLAAYAEACSRLDTKPREQVVATVRAAIAAESKFISGFELLGNSPELAGDRLTNTDVQALVAAVLSTGTPVKALYLWYNSITDEGVVALSQLFQDTDSYRCALEVLDLRGNGVGVAGARVLAEALITSRNATLATLNLNGNPIGDAGGIALAEWLQTSSAVQQLDLGNTELETGAVVALCTVLRDNHTLRDLNIENPRLFSRMEDTVYHLARMLRVNRGLVSLNLSKNRVGDFGAKLLAEYLADNSTLRSLNLRCNNIASVGGEALAGLFLRGSPIEELNLDANRVGSDGGVAFALALRRSITLLSLDLRHNSIDDRGLLALAHAFYDNTTLRQLLVWGNDFGQPSIDAFVTQYHSSFADTGLALDLRPYDCDGKMMLAQES